MIAVSLIHSVGVS